MSTAFLTGIDEPDDIVEGDPGHIVAHDVAHRKRKFVADPWDFGAIGDKLLHPLSERYASLAAAQVDYPFATNLTDQIDWAAWQMAVAVLTIPGGGLPGYSTKQGGTIECAKPGDFQFNRPVLFANNTHIEGERGSYPDSSVWRTVVLRPTADFLGTDGPVATQHALLKFAADWMHFCTVIGLTGDGRDRTGAAIAACSGLLAGGTQGMGETSYIDELGVHYFAGSGVWMQGSQAHGRIGEINARNCNIGVELVEVAGAISIEGLSGDNNAASLLKLTGGSQHGAVRVGSIKAEGGLTSGGSPVPNQDPVIDIDSFQGHMLIESLKASAPTSAGGGPANAMVRLRKSLTGHGVVPQITILGWVQNVDSGGNDSFTWVLDNSAYPGCSAATSIGPDDRGPIHFNDGDTYTGTFSGTFPATGGPRLLGGVALGIGGSGATPDLDFGALLGVTGQAVLQPDDIATVTRSIALYLRNNPGASFVYGIALGAYDSWLQLVAAAAQDIIVGNTADTGLAQFRRNISMATGKVIQSEAARVVGAGGQPSFNNSWVAWAGDGTTTDPTPPAFRKDAQGRVHLQGQASTGTVGNGIFTLPAGYRPLHSRLFVVLSNNAVGKLEVTAAGSVIPRSPSNTAYVSLDGVAFMGEQ